jgi:hypothetical protein
MNEHDVMQNWTPSDPIIYAKMLNLFEQLKDKDIRITMMSATPMMNDAICAEDLIKLFGDNSKIDSNLIKT